jgi:hypothetical protein
MNASLAVASLGCPDTLSGGSHARQQQSQQAYQSQTCWHNNSALFSMSSTIMATWAILLFCITGDSNTSHASAEADLQFARSFAGLAASCNKSIVASKKLPAGKK